MNGRTAVHTLQSLDVVMFKPLSTAYSKELINLHSGQGLSVIKKSDFFHLFCKAWVSTFTQGCIFLHRNERIHGHGCD